MSNNIIGNNENSEIKKNQIIKIKKHYLEDYITLIIIFRITSISGLIIGHTSTSCSSRQVANTRPFEQKPDERSTTSEQQEV